MTGRRHLYHIGKINKERKQEKIFRMKIKEDFCMYTQQKKRYLRSLQSLRDLRFQIPFLNLKSSEYILIVQIYYDYSDIF